MIRTISILALLTLLGSTVQAADLKLDAAPARASEWGYRPAEDAVSAVNPPSFSWRPQKGVVRWEIDCRGLGEDDPFQYKIDAIDMNVHSPAQTFPKGRFAWRYRGFDSAGGATNWSQSRSFMIPESARPMPLPDRAELLSRVPKSHPRLFIRPEDLPRLRGLAAGSMQEEYAKLVADCEKIMKRPPSTEEPPTYPKGIVRGSDPWRDIWWGNRSYTQAALNSAATLAFTRLLGGREEYGQEAKRILLECAKWDPKGATGYRYNDEAGMPYNYYFSRTYTYVHDLLTEKERDICRNVMRIRGEEMYAHLFPRHLWSPYSSHSNRAWHFLGEIGIAFHGEIEGADDWLWFAMNVFQNTYPVWCDDDGGWHEGTSYWSSYISRFTWWADIMKAAVGVNAYDNPYFSQIGYYPMYLMPPGKLGGGFGDLTATRKASSNVSLVSILAAQAGNPHWQWYVEQMDGPKATSGYVGFVRGAIPKVAPVAPNDLPTSRLFAGTGQAYLNTSLEDARDGVQVVFKSSPFGTQSHGYESNNAFLLWAYGERLLIRTGRRDSYGSDHHKKWMWTTRSVNSITVDGIGQPGHSSEAKGQITAFQTSPLIDVVIGEAGDTYQVDKPKLKRFSRAILLIKPELMIVFDRLEAKQDSTFEYWLHAVNEFDIDGQHDITIRAGDVVCPVDFLAPAGLQFSQTDQYDPNPRERVKLREWHLTAKTATPAKDVQFVTTMRPQRAKEAASLETKLTPVDGGYVLRAELADGTVVALLPNTGDAVIAADGLNTLGQIIVQRRDTKGAVVETVRVEER